MKFIVNAHQVHMTPRVIGAIEDRLRDVCAYEPKGAEHSSKHHANWRSKSMGNNAWDGKIRLLKKTSFQKVQGYAFPTGLLPRVMRLLSKLHPNPIIEGLDLAAPGLEPVFEMGHGDNKIVLREHQERLVRAAMQHSRGILVSPTGSGKSLVIACLLHNLYQCSNRTVITVPYTSLMHQLHGTLKGLGHDVGRLGDGHKETERRVVVATIQSLLIEAEAKAPWLKDVTTWIVDEAQFANSDSFKFCSAAMSNTRFRYGLTATMPFDGSEMEIEGLLGPVLEVVSVQEMIDKGLLARPDIQLHRFEHHLKIPIKDYRSAHDQLVLGSGPRNDLLEHLVMENALNGAMLVLVSNLKHGELLKYELETRYDLKSVIFLEGSDNQKMRAAQIAELETNQGILIASTIFDIGVDIPSLRTVVLADPGTDAGRCMQRIGRGLRKLEDKDTCLIIDILDIGQKQLARQADTRASLYRRVYPGMVTEYEKGEALESVELSLSDFV